MSISVVIADDQALVRTGYRMLLDSQPDITVVGEAADGAAALRAVEELLPDVLLLDIRVVLPDGLEVTRRLGARAAAFPELERKPHIVIMTTFDKDEAVQVALREGAVGWVLKTSSPDTLVKAVRAAPQITTTPSTAE